MVLLDARDATTSSSRSGRVLSAVHSTGSIGRLVLADVAGFVDDVRSQA